MAKWQRFRYLPVLPLHDDGRLVTGSQPHIDLSRRAAAEGMVLLKNENKLLPLKQGSAVALFGKATVDYVKGGGGSGDVTVRYIRDLSQGMQIKETEGKVKVYEPLVNFYRENVAQQRSEGKAPGYTVEPEIPAELLQAAAESCDTAIISICRFSAEGWDRKGEPNDGDFYLSCEEQAMVKAVCANFDRIVVVLNVGGMVDTSWFIRETKIQSVLLAWQGGMEGGLAEADVLCGDVNPSGKLTDTFAATFADYPSSYNFNESDDYVCYTDDIFVGYRYFETIPGAAEKVNYPFGFGLSYTEFALHTESFDVANDVLTANITVTNTGSCAGKEVVQLYVSAPAGRLDTPRYELRGFRKTCLLQPGESETVIITVPVAELASYDEASAAYVLLSGEYSIFVGDCVRNLTKISTYNQNTERIVAAYKNRCTPRKLPCRLRADGTYEQLTVSEYDPVYDTSHYPYSPNGEMQHIIPNDFGTPISPETVLFDAVAEGKITLDEFLQTLSDDQLITLLGGCPNRGTADTKGIGGIDGVAIPAVMTADGPAGLRIKSSRGVNTTAWPVATLLACTWDPELIYEIGVAGAEEVKENNFGMWLTPAINIHRSPLCGRNFEYYSEDPLIAGKLAAAMVRGIQSLQVSACVKHFCVNNKETNRKNSDSRLSERALREIYLKAFEIVVKESNVRSVMTAYNLMNGTYTSENKDLLTGILRDEWGYSGLVLTDWCNHAQHYREALAGNNLRMPNGHPARLQKALSEGLITRDDLIANARKVLELILWLD